LWKNYYINIASACFKLSVLTSKFLIFLYGVMKKSLCTWRLQYNHQVHRYFLITL